MLAAIIGHKVIVDQLMKAGADISVKDNVSDTSSSSSSSWSSDWYCFVIVGEYSSHVGG